MNVERELETIVSEVLKDYPAVFFVASKHQQQMHEIVIDGDMPLGIYDISQISRAINQLADEKMPEENYSLEIASPGADSAMLLFRQYPKHIGREFQVQLKDDTQFKGKLVAAENNELAFEVFKTEKPKKKDLPETMRFKHEDIKKANIILSFK